MSATRVDVIKDLHEMADRAELASSNYYKISYVLRHHAINLTQEQPGDMNSTSKDLLLVGELVEKMRTETPIGSIAVELAANIDPPETPVA